MLAVESLLKKGSHAWGVFISTQPPQPAHPCKMHTLRRHVASLRAQAAPHSQLLNARLRVWSTI